MAWKESHKLESRQRILDAAAELFTRKGFNQVGIDDVMQAAGMTRGAFYAHFDSKIQLYEEAIYCAGTAAAQHFSEGVNSLDSIIDNYLSEEHLASSDIRCPMSCLVSDVAHDDARVKGIYTNLLKGFTKHLGQLAQGKHNEETQLLQSIILIGGMAVARSVTDEKLSKKILMVCAKAAKNIHANT
jgi:TetR/AcrR family transcriptional repressor of nem operon